MFLFSCYVYDLYLMLMYSWYCLDFLYLQIYSNTYINVYDRLVMRSLWCLFICIYICLCNLVL